VNPRIGTLPAPTPFLMTGPKVLGDKEKFLGADWLGRTIAGKKCMVNMRNCGCIMNLTRPATIIAF